MSVDKNVPLIRFKGFNGEWAEKELGEITLKIGSGKTPKGGDSTYVLEGVPLIRSQNIYNNLVNLNNVAYITPQIHEEMKNSSVYQHDVLLNITGASIGRSAVYTFSSQANVNQHVCIIRLKNGYNSAFTQLHLVSSKGQQLIDNNQAGGAREGLNFQQIGKMQFSFSSAEEQTQIGTYFQKLDNLINQHQQKHDKLSSIKKAMLEKMFPKQGETVPEIRFKGFDGEWKESNLEKCTDLLTGNPFNSKEFSSEGIFLVRGMNVKRGYLDSSPEISEFWPSSKGLERYLLESEDIVVQMDGALIGKSYAKIKSSNLPAILVQRVTRIRCSQVNPEFIYQYIQKDFLNHISGIKTETAVPHLSLHDIRAFSVFLPERPEQNAIGNYFQKLDALINQHQQQITKLNNIKQACLSKMFV